MVLIWMLDKVLAVLVLLGLAAYAFHCGRVTGAAEARKALEAAQAAALAEALAKQAAETRPLVGLAFARGHTEAVRSLIRRPPGRLELN